MPNYVHRTDLYFIPEVDTPDDLPEPEANFIIDPDMSLVDGHPNYYWVINPDDTIVLMDQAGRDAVDAQRVASLVSAEKELAKQMTDSDRRLLGFMKVMLDEINMLRQALSMTPDRTMSDYRQQTKSNIDKQS